MNHESIILVFKWLSRPHTLNGHGHEQVLMDAGSVVLQTPLGYEFIRIGLKDIRMCFMTHRKRLKIIKEMSRVNRDMLRPTISKTRVFSAISIFI